MAIDPFTEETLPLASAARRLPRLRGGRPVSPSTLWRWATKGLRGIKLETIKVGGTTCTSMEALRRFFAAISLECSSNQPEQQTPAASSHGRRTAAQAAVALDRIGI